MKSKLKLLFRKSLAEEEEFNIAARYFDIIENRAEIKKGDKIICRYSCLPYYKELEKDVKILGGELVNSFSQHEYVASFDYYQDIQDYTFPSWTEYEYQYCGYNGAVVLKGKTNSRKHQWNTHMFAKDRWATYDVASELVNDPLIGPQGLIYRKYIPLKTYEISLCGGLPITNEYRFFCHKDQILSFGYYWSQASPEVLEIAHAPVEAIQLANQVAKIISKNINFFIVDIGETADGNWLVIEIGDAQMAGLSMNDPELLYHNMMILIK